MMLDSKKSDLQKPKYDATNWISLVYGKEKYGTFVDTEINFVVS